MPEVMNLTEQNVFHVVKELFQSRDDSCSEAKSIGNIDANKRPPRTGGATSYHYTKHHELYIDRHQSHRCYRVLTYKENSRGQKQFIDIMSGAGYSRSMNNDLCVYDTRRGALGEKFHPGQYGHSKSGNGVLPRVLVAFECWGKCRRRCGGGISSQYEFGKFVGIVECLDPHYPHSKKHAPAPVPPYFFPKRDLAAPPRSVNRRSIRVQRTL